MKKSSIGRILRGGWSGLFISMGITVVSAASAGAASLCNDCHGMPPIDAAYRNITTGGFKGSHQSHQPTTAAATNCAVCHTGAATYTSGHMDEIVQMIANVNNSPTTATYSKGVFFNQTSVPTLGTCANVNCHFERTTPTWSSARLTAPTGCNVCHDAAPRDGNHPAASGAGKKHGDYYGITPTSCDKCHPDHAAAAKPFSHATSAGKRGLIVEFSAAPNTGGTYSGTLAYPTYLPSKAGARNGTCSNIYCHTNGAGGAPIQSAVWGGTLAADCTGCHGGDSASASPITTGKHGPHVNNAAVLGTNIGCVDCHRKTVSGNRTVSTVGNHVNTFKEYTGLLAGGTARYSATAKTCANIYCHSSGKGTFVTAPAWTGTATIGCNGCHGTTNPLGTPDYANGGAATPTANSHAKHVTGAADCDNCHTTVTGTGTAIKAGATGHINKTFDVVFNAKSGTAATWNAANKTCANVYCHSTAVPVWGGTLPAGCTGCHGGTAGSTKPITSNDHPTHLTAPYGPGAYLGTTTASCQACHTFSTTAANPQHANGATEVLSGAGSACANCHAGVVPAWTATVNRLACTACHGATAARLPNGVVAPNKARFTTTGHGQFDVVGTCAACHDENAPHISGVLGDSMRLYGPNDNTVCTGCHSSGSVARGMSTHVTDLTGTPNSLCVSCHDVHGTTNLGMIRTTISGVTITFTNTSTGLVQTSGAYRGLCQVCHTRTAYFKAGDAASIGHNNNRNCLNCHSHTAAYAFQASTACDSCHGYPPVPAGFKGGLGNYTSAKLEDYAGGSGAHTIPAHIKKTAKASEGWANCAMCHSNGSLSPTTHTMNTPVTPSKVTVDVADKYKFNHQLPLGAAQYNGKLLDGGANATGSCFNTRCHFKPSKKWSPLK